MTGELRPVLGPIAAPVQRMELGPYRCGCNPTYGKSCRDCDGTSTDDWELARAGRDAEKDRARQMRTPTGRAAWLASFAEPMRAAMAADADRRFGRLPNTTTDQTPRRAS